MAAVSIDDSVTPSRMAATAAAIGYRGIILRDWLATDAPADHDAIVSRFDIPVYRGATITVDEKGAAGSQIGTAREQVDVVFARPETGTMRAFFAGQDRLDVLSIPATSAGDVEYATVKRARDNGIAVEFNLGALVRRSGGDRVKVITGLDRLARLVTAIKCPYVVSVAPSTHLELRGPRDVIGLGGVLGWDDVHVEDGLASWAAIVKRTQRVRDDRFIEPGVERLDDETDDR